jgi:flavorubredoxin
VRVKIKQLEESKIRKLLKIVIIVFAIILVLIVSAFAALSLDISSFGATGSETLNPTGNPIGRALVVYDPGFSGAAKQDAAKIADNLQAEGYTVDLAGVRSATAGAKTGYNVIVAGGPIYFGQVSSSIDEYLKTVPTNVKLGVFGATGSSTFSENDFTSFANQVTHATQNENVTLKLILDGNEANDCADLVTNLLQQ